MQHPKTCLLHRSFCYGIMAVILIVCPLFTVTAENNAESNSVDIGKETEAEAGSQETPREQGKVEASTQEQNRDQVPLINQELRSLLDKHHREITVIFVPFLIIFLIFFIWIFFRYRSLDRKIENLVKVNNSLKQDLNVSNLKQPFVDTSDFNDLYQTLNDIQENTQGILKQIETITVNSTVKSDIGHTKMEDPSEAYNIGISEQEISQEIVEFCSDYNSGIEGRQKWGDFIGKYPQNFRIVVVNAEERSLRSEVDIALAPIFKTHPAGYFLACYIDVKNLYAIVPFYDLIVERSTYFSEAFGEVFECSHYDHSSNYRISELIKPAIFEPDDAKESWTLRAPGMLELRKV